MADGAGCFKNIYTRSFYRRWRGQHGALYGSNSPPFSESRLEHARWFQKIGPFTSFFPILGTTSLNKKIRLFLVKIYDRVFESERVPKSSPINVQVPRSEKKRKTETAAPFSRCLRSLIRSRGRSRRYRGKLFCGWRQLAKT